jgi:hypothetical protein
MEVEQAYDRVGAVPKPPAPIGESLAQIDKLTFEIDGAVDEISQRLIGSGPRETLNKLTGPTEALPSVVVQAATLARRLGLVLSKLSSVRQSL